MSAALDPQLLQRVAALLADVTGAPAGSLHAGSTPDNTAGWDSTANYQFILAVEEEFDLAIPATAVLDLRSLADMVRFVAAARG